MRTVLFAAAVLSAAFVGGCGDVPRGRIHGRITFQGKPLANASVVFLAQDNRTYLADIKPDGSYEVSGIALGPVRVSIQQMQPRSAAKSERGATKATYADEKAAAPRAEEPKSFGPLIPPHYADPDQSGLTFELKEPDQEWSADLK